MSNVRKHIHLLSRHSNLPETAANELLHQKLYPTSASWFRLLKSILLVLGAGFAVAGIVFFFAYNWEALNKFVKLGLLQALVVACIATALFTQKKSLISNIALTAGAMLTGVLFAVFGQIYQTGANAYDFFLNWTIAVTLWALMARFPPLWLLYLTLINTTLYLYQQQVSDRLSTTGLFTFLFILNSLAAASSLWWPKYKKTNPSPVWFSNVIMLAAFYCATVAICLAIYEDYDSIILLLIAAVLVLYVAAYIYAMRHQKMFPLAIGGLSILIMISALLLKASEEAASFFLIGFLMLGGVSLLIYYLIQLQKQWANEQTN